MRATFKELHDLTYIAKNEYVLKLARNDIPKLTRTVLKFCYKKSSSLCLQLDNTQENGRRYHVGPKVILQKRARTTNQQLTIFINPSCWTMNRDDEVFYKARTKLSDELKKEKTF